MPREIKFTSQGAQCSGIYFHPLSKGSKNAHKDAPEKVSAIVMAHGLAATKEMFGLPEVAQNFCDAGFAVLLFDYRHWGASEGEPRGFLSPHHQIDDYRAALAWLSTQEKVDPERIGIWGTSLSGGHVLDLAAFDPMVKCVVSQVPAVDVYANMQQNMDSMTLAGLKALMVMDRIGRVQGRASGVMAVNAPDGMPCLIPGTENYERAERQARLHPNVSREITISSLEQLNAWAPAANIAKISPKPLLMILAMKDALTPPDLALEYYEKAGEPKKKVELTCAHYDIYPEENDTWFALAIKPSIEWFQEYL